MAMRYYWGLGIRHMYAHGARGSVDVGKNALEVNDEDVEVTGRHEASCTTAQESPLTGDIAAELNPGSPVPSIASDSDVAASDLDVESVGEEEDFDEGECLDSDEDMYG
jgi:hypothetical protein